MPAEVDVARAGSSPTLKSATKPRQPVINTQISPQLSLMYLGRRQSLPADSKHSQLIHVQPYDSHSNCEGSHTQCRIAGLQAQ